METKFDFPFAAPDTELNECSPARLSACFNRRGANSETDRVTFSVEASRLLGIADQPSEKAVGDQVREYCRVSDPLAC